MNRDIGPFRVRGTKVISPYPTQLTPAEHRLIFILQKVFAPEHILADCYLPKPDRQVSSCRNAQFSAPKVLTTSDLLQIDCLTVDQRGIFIFESKDYVGWIYGHGNRVHWTQVSAYGQNKHQFYNPIRQNSSHLDAIAAIFGNLVPLYSIIVFGREATLKVIADVPEHCYVCTQGNLLSVLKTISSTRSAFSVTQITDIVAKLNASRIDPTTIIRDQHVQEITAHQPQK